MEKRERRRRRREEEKKIRREEEKEKAVEKMKKVKKKKQRKEKKIKTKTTKYDGSFRSFSFSLAPSLSYLLQISVELEELDSLDLRRLGKPLDVNQQTSVAAVVHRQPAESLGSRTGLELDEEQDARGDADSDAPRDSENAGR